MESWLGYPTGVINFHLFQLTKINIFNCCFCYNIIHITKNIKPKEFLNEYICSSSNYDIKYESFFLKLNEYFDKGSYYAQSGR